MDASIVNEHRISRQVGDKLIRLTIRIQFSVALTSRRELMEVSMYPREGTADAESAI